jgi:hypothetical protein
MGPATAGPICFRYIGLMTLPHSAAIGVLCLPALLLAQGTSAPALPKAFAYRGFVPGMTYSDFATRARAIARDDILTCQTMKQTARVMDCGVKVRDPVDSTSFYLSANVIEGRASVISLLDSGDVAIVKRAQDDMRSQLGPAKRRERSMWEWTNGRRFIRLNWRGSANSRVVSITLNDRDVMDRIARYRPTATATKKAKQ